jgi:UDP-2,3-diacylglucosamine pyrophosphatase LpxH
MMLHGHTHRPAGHHDVLDGKPVRRIVTADWLDDRGEVLRLVADAQRGLTVIRDAITAG